MVVVDWQNGNKEQIREVVRHCIVPRHRLTEPLQSVNNNTATTSDYFLTH